VNACIALDETVDLLSSSQLEFVHDLMHSMQGCCLLVISLDGQVLLLYSCNGPYTLISHLMVATEIDHFLLMDMDRASSHKLLHHHLFQANVG
jgi:hypothetical protein